jgi:hypothetical protein
VAVAAAARIRKQQSVLLMERYITLTSAQVEWQIQQWEARLPVEIRGLPIPQPQRFWYWQKAAAAA